MNQKKFDAAIKEQLEYSFSLLTKKGKEYSTEVDRLEHFKKAAALMGTDQKGALFGMLTKHLVSISDMCTDGNFYKREVWLEKITDSINYLLILSAIIKEEENDA